MSQVWKAKQELQALRVLSCRARAEAMKEKKEWISRWDFLRMVQEKRIAAGLCVRCGGPKDEEDEKGCCAECKDKLRLESMARNQSLIRQRLCISCKLENDSGFQKCDDCRRKHSEQTKARTQKRIANGVCTKCGKIPSVKGKRLCPKCLDISRRHSRNRYTDRKSRGICLSCGENSLRFVYCLNCRRKKTQKVTG